MIKAPWTDEQVATLNYYQESGVFHPYTCGGEKCRADLVATVNGWTCPQCDYTQDWAYPISREMIDRNLKWRDGL